MKKSCMLLIALATGLLALPAQAIIITQNINVGGGVIPDGGGAIGLSLPFTVTSSIDAISAVTVSVAVSPVNPGGGFNGGLFATLQNTGGGFAELMNRPGITAPGNPFGYPDSGGMNIVFDDVTNLGTISLYQDVTGPLGAAPLTGSWGTSGNALSSFVGLDPEDDWTFFISDAIAGTPMNLDGVTVTIIGVGNVPEPGTVMTFLTFLVALPAIRRMRRK